MTPQIYFKKYVAFYEDLTINKYRKTNGRVTTNT